MFPKTPITPKTIERIRRRRWAEAAYALGLAPDLARKRAWVEINSSDDLPKLPAAGS